MYTYIYIHIYKGTGTMIYQCWKTSISKKCDSRVIRLHLCSSRLWQCALHPASLRRRRRGDFQFFVDRVSDLHQICSWIARRAMRNMVQGPWESVEGQQRPSWRDGDKPWAKPCPFGNFGKFTLDMFWWDLRASASVPTSRNGGDVVSVFFCGLRWFGTVSAHCGYSYRKKDRRIARIA